MFFIYCFDFFQFYQQKKDSSADYTSFFNTPPVESSTNGASKKKKRPVKKFKEFRVVSWRYHIYSMLMLRIYFVLLFYFLKY